jgi:polysaccharide export outer membrane protein
MCTQCNTPGKTGGGLFSQVQSLTANWKMPWSGSASPSAPINGTVIATGGPTRTQIATMPAPTVQPVDNRQTGEPLLAAQIPVTTMNGPPAAFGQAPVVVSTQLPVGPMPAVAAGPVGKPGGLPVALPPGTVVGGPPAGPGCAGPGCATHSVGYMPPPHPLANAVAGVKATLNDLHTAGPIKHSMPVPPGVPKEFEKRSLPPYIIEPPDVLLIESTAALKDQQPIRGQHLVRPDGRVSLGVYGEVYVAGLTIAQAKEAVVAVLSARLKEVSDRNTNVDVIAYNSKKYYIITDGGGYGEQVYPFPITGNETVLDALSNIYGLPIVASKKNIWIARATPDGSPYPKILPVDWVAISQYGSAATNYQILPGDRIYVQAQGIITFTSKLARVLDPIDRFFGSVLLGSGAVTSTRTAFR